MDKTGETHKKNSLYKNQTNNYNNRHAIKQTPQCTEACTSTCECDRTPFLGRPVKELDGEVEM